MVAARRAHVHLVASEAHLVHSVSETSAWGGSVELLAGDHHPTLLVRKGPRRYEKYVILVSFLFIVGSL